MVRTTRERNRHDAEREDPFHYYLEIIKLLPEFADKKSMEERRTEPRMLCADMVDIVWREPGGKLRRETALLEDISHSGACLQLERALPVGAVVRWRSPGQEFRGRVTHCVYREIGYFAGVEFDERSKWRCETFTPQHLLDLANLVR